MVPTLRSMPSRIGRIFSAASSFLRRVTSAMVVLRSGSKPLLHDGRGEPDGPHRSRGRTGGSSTHRGAGPRASEPLEPVGDRGELRAGIAVRVRPDGEVAAVVHLFKSTEVRFPVERAGR